MLHFRMHHLCLLTVVQSKPRKGHWSFYLHGNSSICEDERIPSSLQSQFIVTYYDIN